MRYLSPSPCQMRLPVMQYWTLCDIYVDLYINGAAWNCALHWHYILKSLINTLNTNSIKLLKNSPFLLIPRLRLNFEMLPYLYKRFIWTIFDLQSRRVNSMVTYMYAWYEQNGETEEHSYGLWSMAAKHVFHYNWGHPQLSQPPRFGWSPIQCFFP